jgi:hypothetical protein
MEPARHWEMASEREREKVHGFSYMMHHQARLSSSWAVLLFCLYNGPQRPLVHACDVVSEVRYLGLPCFQVTGSSKCRRLSHLFCEALPN